MQATISATSSLIRATSICIPRTEVFCSAAACTSSRSCGVQACIPAYTAGRNTNLSKPSLLFRKDAAISAAVAGCWAGSAMAEGRCCGARRRKGGRDRGGLAKLQPRWGRAKLRHATRDKQRFDGASPLENGIFRLPFVRSCCKFQSKAGLMTPSFLHHPLRNGSLV
jgi:hypothetical protein